MELSLKNKKKQVLRPAKDSNHCFNFLNVRLLYHRTEKSQTLNIEIKAVETNIFHCFFGTKEYKINLKMEIWKYGNMQIM